VLAVLMYMLIDGVGSVSNHTRREANDGINFNWNTVFEELFHLLRQYLSTLEMISRVDSRDLVLSKVKSMLERLLPVGALSERGFVGRY
jgi:hypothetical protein